jgi:chaperone modulatory protein CbpM
MAATTRSRLRTGTDLATKGPGFVSLEALAREAGVHPEMVRRLIGYGLIEPHGGTRAAPLFSRRDAPLLARAGRLRRDLGLNWAGAVLACDLLARIDELEQLLRDREPPHRHHEVITWTRTV